MPHVLSPGDAVSIRFKRYAMLPLAIAIAALAAAPAWAGHNGDLEVFGGGLAKSNPQGFAVGPNAGNRGTGSVTIKRDSLEQVTWFKSRRQVSLEDTDPIVTDRRSRGGNGALGPNGGLTQVTSGGYAAAASGGPRNLSPANLGGMVKPQTAQARPMVHTGRGASTQRATSAGPQPPTHRSTPTASAYNPYQSGAPVTAAADAESAHMRNVKARLLDPNTK